MLWHSDECVLLPCFNAQPDIFAVMNYCVVALSVFSADILTWSTGSSHSVQLLGQPQVNKVKTCLPSLKSMKRPQTKFHADTMSNAQVSRSKKVKIYCQVKLHR